MSSAPSRWPFTSRRCMSAIAGVTVNAGTSTTSSNKPGQSAGSTPTNVTAPRPGNEVLDADLVAGEAQEPGVRVDDLIGAADPPAVGALYGDAEPVALVDGVVPRLRRAVVLLGDQRDPVACPRLMLADPAPLVLVVPVVVEDSRARRCVGVAAARSPCRWSGSSHHRSHLGSVAHSSTGGRRQSAQVRTSLRM